MRSYGVPVVVSINRFTADTDEEVAYLSGRCAELGFSYAVSDVFTKGGEGGVELAVRTLEALDQPSDFQLLYELDQSIKAKVEVIAKKIYGAAGVAYTDDANKKIKQIEDLGFGGLPICIAKTQYSFSDNQSLLGRPEGFEVTVKDAKVSAGAGFIVVFTGNIMTMPGLPKRPAAERIDVDADGRISGLF
jgi:formate--tetrahydrofolate ligase